MHSKIKRGVDFKKNKKSKGESKEKEKKKEKENAFTWLQACFLGDVGVIWCNSLGDSHFQTNVINDVEILFNYYLHTTFYGSHTLTSCTHYTKIFYKHYTCDSVLINVVIQNYASCNV